jgi:hypothetical protein
MLMIIPTIGRVEQSYPLTIMLVVVHCHWGGGRRRGGGGGIKNTCNGQSGEIALYRISNYMVYGSTLEREPSGLPLVLVLDTIP